MASSKSQEQDKGRARTYPLVFQDKLVQLELFPVLVEELLALVGCLVIELLRHQGPVPAAQPQAGLQDFDLIVGPEGRGAIGLDQIL